jgi:hypothetical protein
VLFLTDFFASLSMRTKSLKNEDLLFMQSANSENQDSIKMANLFYKDRNIPLLIYTARAGIRC